MQYHNLLVHLHVHVPVAVVPMSAYCAFGIYSCLHWASKITVAFQGAILKSWKWRGVGTRLRSAYCTCGVLCVVFACRRTVTGTIFCPAPSDGSDVTSTRWEHLNRMQMRVSNIPVTTLHVHHCYLHYTHCTLACIHALFNIQVYIRARSRMNANSCLCPCTVLQQIALNLWTLSEKLYRQI